MFSRNSKSNLIQSCIFYIATFTLQVQAEKRSTCALERTALEEEDNSPPIFVMRSNRQINKDKQPKFTLKGSGSSSYKVTWLAGQPEVRVEISHGKKIWLFSVIA